MPRHKRRVAHNEMSSPSYFRAQWTFACTVRTNNEYRTVMYCTRASVLQSSDDDDSATPRARYFALPVHQRLPLVSPWLEYTGVLAYAPQDAAIDAVAAVGPAAEDAEWRERLPVIRILVTVQCAATTTIDGAAVSMPRYAQWSRYLKRTLGVPKATIAAMRDTTAIDTLNGATSALTLCSMLKQTTASMRQCAERLYRLLRPLDYGANLHALVPFYDVRLLRSLTSRELASVVSLMRRSPDAMCALSSIVPQLTDTDPLRLMECWKLRALTWSADDYDSKHRVAWAVLHAAEAPPLPVSAWKDAAAALKSEIDAEFSVSSVVQYPNSDRTA